MTSTRKFVGGRWVDVPDRPNDVLANIRRNNKGKTIAETTASTDKAFMPYDKRYPGAFYFLLDARWCPSRDQRKAAVGALEDAGGSATLTKKGATGMVVKGAPQSPMAGAQDTRGLAWDAIRAGIHERATGNVLDDRWMGSKAPKVDMASEGSKRKVLGEFDKAVAAEKDRLAGQFVDNLTKSIQDDIDKNWKPAAPTATQKAESTAREKVGTGTTTEERKGNLETWNAARQEAHAEEAKRHEDSMKYLDDTEKWMKDFAKQHGLKDPTQSAAKGGSAHSLPVSRSEDRFLDDLIGEMEV